jgi:hypothetical protein
MSNSIGAGYRKNVVVDTVYVDMSVDIQLSVGGSMAM